MTEKCDAHHDGHDCGVPGACSRALLAMLERIDSRPREERLREEPGPARKPVPPPPSRHETA